MTAMALQRLSIELMARWCSMSMTPIISLPPLGRNISHPKVEKQATCIFTVHSHRDFTGQSTIRGTHYDCLVIGLWLDRPHGEQLHAAGFDGIYSYFASDGFSYGATTAHWKSMCDYVKRVPLSLSSQAHQRVGWYALQSVCWTRLSRR